MFHDFSCLQYSQLLLVLAEFCYFVIYALSLPPPRSLCLACFPLWVSFFNFFCWWYTILFYFFFFFLYSFTTYISGFFCSWYLCVAIMLLMKDFYIFFFYLIIVKNCKTVIVSYSLNPVHPIAVAQVKTQPKDQMQVVQPFKLSAICRPKYTCLTWSITRGSSTHNCLTLKDLPMPWLTEGLFWSLN